jgi:hypothetical protein
MLDGWLVIIVVAAVAALSARVFASRRSLHVPVDIKRWLEERGFEPQRLERRWLTRGPFPDIRPAGVQHSGLLFHIHARDRSGALASGWLWLPPGWQWTSHEHWRLHLDPGPDQKPRGGGTPIFALILLAAAALVLLVMITIVRQHS